MFDLSELVSWPHLNARALAGVREQVERVVGTAVLSHLWRFHQAPVFPDGSGHALFRAPSRVKEIDALGESEAQQEPLNNSLLFTISKYSCAKPMVLLRLGRRHSSTKPQAGRLCSGPLCHT